MSSKLKDRLEDIPGVESVTIDIETADVPRINVRLQPHADEGEVLERVRALLVAYGVRSGGSRPLLRVDRMGSWVPSDDLGVDIRITPIKGGARVEVFGKVVRSFRVVAANPVAIAQGVADAWCQVVGKIPVEIVSVSLSDHGELKVVASDGDSQTVGRAGVERGWTRAIGRAVGLALGLVEDGSRRPAYL